MESDNQRRAAPLARQSGVVWAAAAAAVCAAALLLHRAGDAPAAASGTHDFIEYWSAYQLAASGNNPYDPASMLALQAELGRATAVPLMMWNPPWLLVLLAPVLRLPFVDAALAFYALNAVLIAGTAVIAASFFRFSRPFPEALLAVVLAYPVYQCLQVGQVSIAITFIAACMFYYLERRNDFAAGVCAALLFLKPHLLYLIFAALLWYVLRSRRWMLAAAFVLTLSLLFASAAMLYPQALAGYAAAFSKTQDAGMITVYQWKTASLPGVVQYFFPAMTVLKRKVVMFALPAGCALLLLAVLFRSRSIRWPEAAPPLLCLSLFTSPYGWVFDQTLLSLAQAAAVKNALQAQASTARKIAVFSSLTVLQVAVSVLASRAGAEHHEFFWVPLAMLAIWHASAGKGALFLGARQQAMQ